MRYVRRLVGFAMVSAIAIVGLNLAAPRTSGTQEFIVVPVIHVVDGDTLDVMQDGQKQRLRLIGMDTPETVDPRKGVQCYGPEASARAHELLDNQWVAIAADASQGEKDRYGRRLAYLWLPDGRNYAEVMIRDGYAHEYTYSKAYTYRPAFRMAQADAQLASSGLWAACPV